MDLIILGQNIRAARQSRLLTQKEVAAAVGVSLNAYTRIERGETNVQFMRLVKIAEVLHVSVAALTREPSEGAQNIVADVLKIRSDIELIKNILANND